MTNGSHDGHPWKWIIWESMKNESCRPNAKHETYGLVKNIFVYRVVLDCSSYLTSSDVYLLSWVALWALRQRCMWGWMLYVEQEFLSVIKVHSPLLLLFLIRKRVLKTAPYLNLLHIEYAPFFYSRELVSFINGELHITTLKSWRKKDGKGKKKKKKMERHISGWKDTLGVSLRSKHHGKCYLI